MFDNQSAQVIGNSMPSAILPMAISHPKNDVSARQNLIDYIGKELMSLPDDWDGYGGCAIDKNVLAHTIYILNQLPYACLNGLDKDDILPTANGTITIEWHNASTELLLDVGKDFSTYYVQIQRNTTKINNHFVASNNEQMQAFIRELKHFF